MSSLPEPPLSNRIRRVLHLVLEGREPTPEAVSALNKADLLRQPEFGQESLKQLKQWLAHHGCALESKRGKSHMAIEETYLLSLKAENEQLKKTIEIATAELKSLNNRLDRVLAAVERAAEP